MTGRAITAAGVVLIRAVPGSEPEVLVIHRDRYDDWSFPKGKDDPGETARETALRELEEETHHRATLMGELRPQHYTVAGGRPKVVRYFVGRPLGNTPFEPNSEVDAVKWVTFDKAKRLLTYKHDRRLLNDPAVSAALATGNVFLVRHAHAGDRSKWKDDDRLRPLTKKGRRQANALDQALSSRGVDLIHSSPYVRCVQTVDPLASTVGKAIVEVEWLAEGSDTDHTIGIIEQSSGSNVVLCTHGDLVPDVIRRLEKGGVELRSPNGKLSFAKGSTWIISVRDGVPIKAQYVPAPKV